MAVSGGVYRLVFTPGGRMGGFVRDDGRIIGLDEVHHLLVCV
jgi:hypothetical protein